MNPFWSLVARLGFVVASLSALFAGYMLTGFGLNDMGDTEGMVLQTVGVELLLAAVYLVRKSRFLWAYALVTIVEGLFLYYFFFLLLLDISWFTLYYSGLVLANTFVVVRYLPWQRLDSLPRRGPPARPVR